jgi:hypothetical protein
LSVGDADHIIVFAPLHVVSTNVRLENVQIDTERRRGFARLGPLSELDVFFPRPTEKFSYKI